jgi:acyl-CoA-binding protein
MVPDTKTAGEGQQRFTASSEKCAATILRIEEQFKQATAGASDARKPGVGHRTAEEHRGNQQDEGEG